MKDILIYGFGGFGHEVACILQHINEVKPTWKIVGYIDDGVEVGTECKYGKVLGNIDTLNAWESPISVAIAVGSPKYLKEIPAKIYNPLVDFPNIIAPNVFFFDKMTYVFRNIEKILGSVIGHYIRLYSRIL